MTDQDLAYTTISGLAPLIKSQEVSPVELTELALARIDRYDGPLNSFITIMADSARAEAKAAEQAIVAGNYLGPLHGIPIAAKDLYATAGTLTTFGSLLFADWVPDHDATVVKHLRAAGAIIVGKTNLQELAYGTTSANPHYGQVYNPWKPSFHPGGSSGGSAAALAAGFTWMALEATPAPRSASPPPAAAWSASSRPSGASPNMAACRSPGPWITPAP